MAAWRLVDLFVSGSYCRKCPSQGRLFVLTNSYWRCYTLVLKTMGVNGSLPNFRIMVNRVRGWVEQKSWRIYISTCTRSTINLGPLWQNSAMASYLSLVSILGWLSVLCSFPLFLIIPNSFFLLLLGMINNSASSKGKCWDSLNTYIFLL